jgi:hypothetical protein
MGSGGATGEFWTEFCEFTIFLISFTEQLIRRNRKSENRGREAN